MFTFQIQSRQFKFNHKHHFTSPIAKKAAEISTRRYKIKWFKSDSTISSCRKAWPWSTTHKRLNNERFNDTLLRIYCAIYTVHELVSAGVCNLFVYYGIIKEHMRKYFVKSLSTWCYVYVDVNSTASKEKFK